MPPRVKLHLAERMRDRNISLDDLNHLRLWIESQPEVPDGEWYKDFGTFKLCGNGHLPKTFLLPGQAASGKKTVGLDVRAGVPIARIAKSNPRNPHLLLPGSWPAYPVAHICLPLANVGPMPSPRAAENSRVSMT